MLELDYDADLVVDDSVKAGILINFGRSKVEYRRLIY